MSIFYLPFFNSVTKKKIPRLKKYWGGRHLPPCSPPPQVTPIMTTTLCTVAAPIFLGPRYGASCHPSSAQHFKAVPGF
jgi:hypothetical protein